MHEKEMKTKIVDSVDELCKKYNVPGVAVGYIYKEHTYIHTYGVTNSIKQSPVTADTGFEIASLSKSFTAFAVQSLIFDGKWSLDMPITKLNPELELWFENQNVAGSITIGHLLYHTSGLSNLLINKINSACNSTARLIHCLNRQVLQAAPGTKYEYTSLNYDVLAYLIELETGYPFFMYLQNSVLAPLKLQQTVIPEIAEKAKQSYGHKWCFGKVVPCKSKHHEANLSSGYIVSTINDMMRWLQIHMEQACDIPQRYHDIVQSYHIRKIVRLRPVMVFITLQAGKSRFVCLNFTMMEQIPGFLQ